MEHLIRLFIADDHTIVRKGFVRLLSLYREIEVVGEAGDGMHAVKMVREIEPDIVLMDIGMPILNGLEATQRIKRDLPKVRVIILTAHDSEQYIHRVIRSGAHGYLLKNIDADALFEAIKAVSRNEYVFPESAREIYDHQLGALCAGKSGEFSDRFHSLTNREREILQLIAEGKNHQQIAKLLNVSVRTVDTHRNNIIQKLDIHDTANLVLYAIRNGISILPK